MSPTPDFGRILLVHNRYKHPGGEDVAVAAEAAMLARQGHGVELFEDQNVEPTNAVHGAQLALESVYSQRARRDLSRVLAEFQPAVVHVHNTFARLSASVYAAARAAGVPVVHTIHNYRTRCLNALCLLDDEPCVRCFDGPLSQGIRFGCYGGSVARSAVVAASLTVQRRLTVDDRGVQRFIALTEFQRDLVVRGGLPASRVTVKAHHLEDPPRYEDGPREDFALFVGRLSPEKGLQHALPVWPAGLPLKVVGEGPDGDALRSLVAGRPEVEFIGPVDKQGVLSLMRRAAFLLMPSHCFESFGLVLVEALACGLPVLTVDVGGRREIIEDGVTGVLYRDGDPHDFALALARIAGMLTPDHRLACRREFERKYTAEVSYDSLLSIYRAARAQAQEDAGPGGKPGRA